MTESTDLAKGAHNSKVRTKHILGENPAAKTDSTAEEHSPVAPAVGEFADSKSK